MNLAIPDVRTLEVFPATFGYLSANCRPSAIEDQMDLGVPLLAQAIKDAAGMGFNFLSLGGENTVCHPGVAPLCREAHRMRMLTTLTTRSGLLNARRLRALVRSIDLLGIRSEAGMASSLEPVRRSGIPFALVFHLTRDNMGEMEPAAAFAANHGAAMLYVEPSGALSDTEMATAWMMIECLRDIHRGDLALRLDVLNRYSVPIEAEDLDAWQAGVTHGSRFLGEVISPLVVEEDGTVVPLRRGFPHSLALGNLHDKPLSDLVAVWKRDGMARFCDLYRTVLLDVQRDGRAFVDLHQMLAAEAQADHNGSLSASG